LSNGKEFKTKNPTEINSNAIKAETSVIILRNMLEQLQIFCITFNEIILDENNEENGKRKRIENDYDIDRY
jgi:hypothetical protein